jgi:cytochrome c peroxidase
MKLSTIILFFTLLVCSGFGVLKWKKSYVPKHFPKPHFDIKKVPLDEAKINLGQALFYDPILSSDSSISCSSCHSPYNAFAHTDHDLSHGINDSIGFRNAPALFNLAWQKSFMWDGAVNHLDMQALAPLTDSKEMNETINNVVKKINKSKIYPILFFAAFGDSIASGAKMLKALSQFQLTLISSNSKYDKVILKKANFTEQEKKGYELFKKNCNSCHREPMFTNFEFANNGLSTDPTLNDFGKYRITKKTEDSLLFKVPSLRNLSYTFPYMHDGRFTKIREVIEHYTSGIQNTPTLSKDLKNKIVFSSAEKTDLIAFLLTLNDTSFVFDKKNKFPTTILIPRVGN